MRPLTVVRSTAVVTCRTSVTVTVCVSGVPLASGLPPRTRMSSKPSGVLLSKPRTVKVPARSPSSVTDWPTARPASVHDRPSRRVRVPPVAEPVTVKAAGPPSWIGTSPPPCRDVRPPCRATRPSVPSGLWSAPGTIVLTTVRWSLPCPSRTLRSSMVVVLPSVLKRPSGLRLIAP